MKKYLRVNLDVVSMVGFLAAILFSVGICAWIVFACIVPYLFNHVTIGWH